MPRPRPPHLHRETTRHGVVVWYVRLWPGPRTRLRAAYGTPEFEEQYQAAIAGGRPVKPAPAAASLEWLIDRYREKSAHWNNTLAPATRRQRNNIFMHVLERAGKTPYALIRKSDIEGGKDDRAQTPSQARNFLDAMRGLFRWALEADHVKIDPTAGVRNPLKKKTQGFIKWSEADAAHYEASYPIGTKERVWFDVLLYTGLRRGDAVVVGKQHLSTVTIDVAGELTPVKILTLRTEKGGEQVTVTLPVLPPLQASIDAGPIGDLAFICGDRRRPLTKESFGNMFSAACRAIGLHNRSAHGVRKLGATRAADAGATDKQLQALFGWLGPQMPALYTRDADRKRLSIEAMHKLLGNGLATSIPAPGGKVRGPGRKA